MNSPLAGRVYLCRVAGDPIRQMTLRSSEIGFLYMKSYAI